MAQGYAQPNSGIKAQRREVFKTDYRG